MRGRGGERKRKDLRKGKNGMEDERKERIRIRKGSV